MSKTIHLVNSLLLVAVFSFGGASLSTAYGAQQKVPMHIIDKGLWRA